MPRSYSFDHFKSHEHQNAPQEEERELEKQTFSRAQQMPLPGEERLSYGKKFAQTEELAIAHQMNAQLEELAGLREDASPKMSRSRKPAARAEASSQALPEEMPPRNGAPIGALPPPQLRMPAGLLRDVWADAGRYLRMLQEAARDARTATIQLLRLPLEAAQIAARRVLPRKA